MWRCVEGRRVQDGDTVPAGLHLDGEVTHESVFGGGVVEDGFEGGVFEGGAVDVAGDPVVVEDWRALFFFFESIFSVVRYPAE